MSLPPALASSVLQQHVNAVLQNNSMQSIAMQKQLDGAADTSEEEGSEVSDDNLDDNDDDADKDEEDENDADNGAEEEPLNSDDDVSEEEQSDLFDTDNVVVCQYDKVNFVIGVYLFVLDKYFHVLAKNVGIQISEMTNRLTISQLIRLHSETLEFKFEFIFN